ncbi:hypothetical protein CYMTET_10999 [Cymbomonas tetramitiformis]|uniref:Uncharacterized protein n=1 Tax=Cymbomonas tetramitiformis TaxID=36881 RepID=A0AAE0GN76_9CHLO|nr:hypothetical protein CYMTET_10999 [Cymbomonas tetramitiformis]
MVAAGFPVERRAGLQKTEDGKAVEYISIKYEKDHYTEIVLATTITHLPIMCKRLGADQFDEATKVFPSVRVNNPGATYRRTGNRQLHIVGKGPAGKTVKHLLISLSAGQHMESYYKGGRNPTPQEELSADVVMVLMVDEQSAHRLESGAKRIWGIRIVSQAL